ncbi:MAG: hypothetical protein K1X79_13350 [Oligoflexia bacterium]|nr:hypothetical protein [Oligoflexia bacterium]
MKSQRLEDLSDTHSIIQCPHCQTKFAIELANIAHLDNPRFHCSRCDHVFVHEAKPREGKRIEENVTPTPPALNKQIEQTEEKTSASVLEQVPRGFSLGAAQPTPTQTAPKLSSPGQQIPEPDQMRFDFQAPTFSASSRTNAALERKPIEYSAPTFERQPTSSPTLPDLSSPSRAGLSRWASFALMAAPLLFFLSAMVGASAYLSQDPDRADKLITGISGNEPQVAPADLSITKAQFKKITLDSGETAFLISGTLTNASDQDFRDITLEGLGFDASGSVVARTQVDAAATLVKTRVRALSTQMISDLQSGKIKNKQDLRAGQSRDFLFALTSGNPGQARFYSVRVYSVH